MVHGAAARPTCAPITQIWVHHGDTANVYLIAQIGGDVRVTARPSGYSL
jgi:hypothetical protein